eukprot:CCRYP_006799-RA/>CCRYP_006799-RA protein AED:0.02 eAED:0.10 QI:0/-1/0/1/-1/1/1/0/856
MKTKTKLKIHEPEPARTLLAHRVYPLAVSHIRSTDTCGHMTSCGEVFVGCDEDTSDHKYNIVQISYNTKKLNGCNLIDTDYAQTCTDSSKSTMMILSQGKKAVTCGSFIVAVVSVLSIIYYRLNKAPITGWIDLAADFIGDADVQHVAMNEELGSRRKLYQIVYDPKSVLRKPIGDVSPGVIPGDFRPILDPKSLTNILDINTIKDKSVLLDDGTYLIYQDKFNIFWYDTAIKSHFCDTVLNNRQSVTRAHYHAGNCKTFDGQFGNRLGWLYGMKIIAYAAQFPIYFTCELKDGEVPNGAASLMALNSKKDILGARPTNRNGEEISVLEACQACGRLFCSWNTPELDLASDAMISDWNDLASRTLMSPQDQDDAIIHLRLGDALYARNGHTEDKGLFPHATYIKLLMQAQQEKGTIGSIGVVTAPFKGSFVRSQYDMTSTSKSETIAMDLLDALHTAFPHAEIRLHNSPSETIIDSLVRIVNARKVAICGCSTFCPYPLLATKGIGYIYDPGTPRFKQNLWVKNAAERYENYRLFETPLLNGVLINNHRTGEKLADGDLLGWLRTQSPDVGNIDIQGPPILRVNFNDHCTYVNADGHKVLAQGSLEPATYPTLVASKGLFDVLRLDIATKRPIWNNVVIDELDKIVTSGGSLSSYDHPHSAEDVALALGHINLDVSKLRVGVVSGAVSPWVEYILRSAGASHIVSIDYNFPIVCGVPWMESKSEASFDSEEGVYNLLVSFSGIEHYGLGRFGDPIDKSADSMWMKRILKALAPGGFLLLAVPTSSKSYVVHNFYRVYGPDSLSRLLKGFEFIGRVWDGRVLAGWPDDDVDPKLFPQREEVVFDWKYRNVLILKKRS